MSRANVEAFQRSIDAYNRGDVEALLSDLDAEIEWRPVLPVVLGGQTTVYRGHDGIREMLRDLDEIFDERRLAFSEVHDMGDRVVAVGRLSIRGRGSGLQSESPFGWLATFRKNGKVTRIETYLDATEALEIAGVGSQLSVEVRAMAEAVNAGDLEGFLARTAENVEFTSLVAEAEDRTFRGHAGVRDWWEKVLGAFQDPRWEVLDMREAGDRGVAKSRLTATLAGTEVVQTMWMAARLRDGKLGWWAFFRTEDEALKAAGLPE